MSHWHLIWLIGLTACSSPGLYFRDHAATRISVAGNSFDVRTKGRLAEAIRLNPTYAPRPGPIAAQATFAITRVSGCPVKELRGDQAVFTAILACNGPAPPQPPRSSYTCVELRRPATNGGYYTEFDCDPT